MWELSNRASDAVDLASVARPHMMGVHEFVGENTQLGILREREVLIIERMSAPNAVIHRSKTAGRLPAHASSCGLVLLAYAPKHVREAYLRGRCLPSRRRRQRILPLCARCSLDPSHHFAELSGHIDEGTTGITVPVFDAGGRRSPGSASSSIRSTGKVCPRSCGSCGPPRRDHAGSLSRSSIRRLNRIAATQISTPTIRQSTPSSGRVPCLTRRRAAHGESASTSAAASIDPAPTKTRVRPTAAEPAPKTMRPMNTARAKKRL